jgi:hypothetical protein
MFAAAVGMGVVRAGVAAVGTAVVVAGVAAAVGAAVVGAGIAAPAVAAAAPRFAGSDAGCNATKGTVVAVDFGPWQGPVALGCDTSSPASGIALLTDTGFTTAGDQHDGPAFVCRIGSGLFAGGTQYPTPAQDPCIVTPPASAYWSYWLAGPGATTWKYSPLTASSDHPQAGEIQAWVYGATDISGTTGQPAFTPQQVRDQETGTGGGGGTGSGAGSSSSGAGGGDRNGSSTGGRGRANPAATALPAELARAIDYLVSTRSANAVPGGTSLKRNGYYESAPRFADFDLTLDGAVALAATGRDAPVLERIVNFIGSRRKDGSGRSIDAWTEIGTRSANGGPIAKEALLAEVARRNPRRFGGHNLIAALDKLICRRTDRRACAGGPGSYFYGASTFDQALGIIAQLRAGDVAHAARAIRYLERHQHHSGAWPSVIPSTGDSEVDSTAIAAMALALVNRDPGASFAVRRARAWIAHRQERDGGFPGAAGDSTNSTALAIQALRLPGTSYTTPIDHAISFLAAEQNPDGGFNIAAGGQPRSDVRASTQVVGGLVGTSFGTLRSGGPGKARERTVLSRA